MAARATSSATAASGMDAKDAKDVGSRGGHRHCRTMADASHAIVATVRILMGNADAAGGMAASVDGRPRPHWPHPDIELRPGATAAPAARPPRRARPSRRPQSSALSPRSFAGADRQQVPVGVVEVDRLRRAAGAALLARAGVAADRSLAAVRRRCAPRSRELPIQPTSSRRAFESSDSQRSGESLAASLCR